MRMLNVENLEFGRVRGEESGGCVGVVPRSMCQVRHISEHFLCVVQQLL